MENEELQMLFKKLMAGFLSKSEIKIIAEKIYLLGYQDSINEAINKIDKI